MLTPTRSRTEYTRGAVVAGTPGLAVVGATVGTGAVAGPTVVGGNVDATRVVGGTDVGVDVSLLAFAETATGSEGVGSSARDPGARSSTNHAIPATIDPNRTACVELSATHCESAAFRIARIGQENHSLRWSAKKCTSSGFRMSARSHCRK